MLKIPDVSGNLCSPAICFRSSKTNFLRKKSFETPLFFAVFAVFGFFESAMSESFPQSGLMKAQTTYEGAAIYANIHKYEGNVTAKANYVDESYSVPAGQYLPANGVSEDIAACLENYYCAGGNFYYNASNNQGLKACPADYNKSAEGSSSEGQCYKDCSSNIASGEISANASVVGGRIYQNGTDKCTALECNPGYHLEPNYEAMIADAQAGSGRQFAAIDGAGQNVTVSSAFSSNNNTGTSEPLIVCSDPDDASSCVEVEPFANEITGLVNASTYGLTSSDKNTFVVNVHSKGRFRGRGLCSTVGGTNNPDSKNLPTWSNPTVKDVLADETGNEGAKYCWCRLDSFTPASSSMQSFEGQWMFGTNEGSAENCSELCAFDCGYSVFASVPLRNAIFKRLLLDRHCEANILTITWNDAPAGSVDSSNDRCTFDGDIITPYAAPTPPKGQRFIGWEFKTTEE